MDRVMMLLALFHDYHPEVETDDDGDPCAVLIRLPLTTVKKFDGPRGG